MPGGSGTPMRRRRGEQAGWSLVELVMVIGVSLVVGAIASATLAPLGSSARALGAARYLAARLQRERIEAVRSGRVCGLRFDDDGTKAVGLFNQFKPFAGREPSGIFFGGGMALSRDGLFANPIDRITAVTGQADLLIQY